MASIEPVLLSDIEVHKLLGQLEDGIEQEDALRRLATAEWKRDHVTALRFGGHISTLIQLIESATPKDILKNVLEILLAAARQDVASKDVLIKGGAIRRLCKLLETPCENFAVLLSVRLLHQCINSGDIDRTPAVDEIFRLGAASKATRFLDGDDESLAQATGGLFWEITDISACRERCRDLGILPVILRLLSAHPDVPGYMGFVNNLSRSEALHLTLQEYGVIDVLQGVLEHTSVEVNRTQALITVAHVYAGQEMHAQSDALLSRYDASLSVMTMLDACLHGDSMFGGACWALEEVVQAVQSLSQKPQHAEKLWKVGCIELLIEVLTKRAEDMDAAFQACRTIANMAGVSSLKGRMQQKKEIVKAAQAHEASEDLRVQDAAKGALLQLGALKDESVLAANSALTGDNRDYSQKYDVFLSHKRTDSKDFARALYNLLVVRSFKTFLDYEYREELSDLGQIVANSANLIFIMTDNIFDSPWCIRELEAAVASKTNIILLVKEGSRWKNEEGLKICEFPGGHILGKLSDDTRKVFTRKALYHSDEYYQTFVDMLVKKIVRWPSEAAAAAAGVASLGAVEGSSAVPGGGGGGGGGAGGASSGAAAVAPWLTPIWPQPQSSDPMMATAMAAAAAARQSIFTGGAGLMPAAPFGGGGGGFMHSPGTGAAELMSLMSGELWGLRRDVLSGLQDVRREHASELHQFKLDVSQQLQQLHRSSQQTQTAVSDLQHRLGELLQLVPSISSSAAAAAARAAATAVAASENGSSSATGVGGGGGSYCLGSEPSAGGCGAVIHAPAALSDLQMAAMQRQVEAIAAGLQHVSVQVQQQQQQQRRTTAFMASSAAGAGGGPWAAPHEDLLQNPLMSVLPPGINTAAFPAQEGSSSGANTSHVASPAPSNASFGSGSASGALTGGQFNGSGGRNGVAVSGGGFVRSTRGQQGHGLHGCLPQISGKQQR